ncbi:MAG: glycoside hydrolase, partial [Acidobacteria bacterium]|nr:glycoside hydrolase [Acidobacteriota bacterium]
ALFVADDRQLDAILKQHFLPDISVSPQSSALGFVHRKLSFADVYFFVNTSNRHLSTSARLRRQPQSARWWDVFTSKSRAAPRNAAIQVELEPYESAVLVVSNQQSTPAPNHEQSTFRPLSTVDLEHDWRVTFPGLGRTVSVSDLRSWSDDPETRFYSGQVIYEKEFFLAQEQAKAYLDFGGVHETEARDRHGRFVAGLESPIREACQIFIDDHLLGSIWKPPYTLELNGLSRGLHRLRIDVYNTAINRLARQALPDYRLLDSRYGQRFIPQDTEDLKPLPSGLLRSPRLLVAAPP